MALIIYTLRRGIELLLWPFDKLPPFWALTLLSILTGFVLLWLVGKTTKQSLVARARDQMTSAIYEIRLYLDSPLRVFASQGRLLKWSFVYIASMVPAFLVAALPLGLLYFHLEVRYGLLPLEVNKATVVKFQMEDGIDGHDAKVSVSDGAALLPARLYDKATGLLAVKAKVTKPQNAEIFLEIGDTTVKKSLLVAGHSNRAAVDRLKGLDLLFQFGEEPPLDDVAPIKSVTVAYEPWERTWLGMPWWLYWLLAATVAALGLRKKLDIAI